ncbi:MAG: hypothetical protein Ta2D_05450 [Rickettsiales bacterium]|nr:MAG: hypothetical protein Ta2D_05450 [Rickettsiales bacterium]
MGVLDNYIDSLDKILQDIAEPTLTENEIEIIHPQDPESIQEKYDTLFNILQTRGGTGSKKLKNNASVVNVEINKDKRKFNNILFCGGTLEVL